MSVGSASGVARLVLIAAALVGFLAMHGFDVTTTTGLHHTPALAATGSGADGPMVMPGTGAALQDAPDRSMTAAEPGKQDGGHDAAMAGCVFVLLALAGGLVLRALRVGVATAAPIGSVLRAPGRVPARAPPCPVFVSLCVFRL